MAQWFIVQDQARWLMIKTTGMMMIITMITLWLMIITMIMLVNDHYYDHAG